MKCADEHVTMVEDGVVRSQSKCRSEIGMAKECGLLGWAEYQVQKSSCAEWEGSSPSRREAPHHRGHNTDDRGSISYDSISESVGAAHAILLVGHRESGDN